MKKSVNFYIDIPKDIKGIKRAVAFGLTKRQLICFTLAGFVGIPSYLFIRKVIDQNLAMLLMVIIMLPFFAFALYSKDNLPLEAILKNYIEEQFIKEKCRPVIYENNLEGARQIKEYKVNNKKGKKSKVNKNSSQMLKDFVAVTENKKMKKANSAAASLPFESIGEDGVMHVSGNRFSIMMEFEDLNYEQANEGTQKDMWSDWCMLLNSLDLEADYQMVLHNKYADSAESYEKLKLLLIGDTITDEMIREYNEYLLDVLKKGNKGMEKHMYLVVTYKSTLKRSRAYSNDIKERISNSFKDWMDIETRWMDGYERLGILFPMLNPYRDEKMMLSFDQSKNGMVPIKEQLCNHAFTFGDRIDSFRVGKKLGAAYYMKLDANKISDRYLSEYFKGDSEIIMSFHIKIIDQKKALKILRELLSGLQANVIDEQKKAVNNGYGMNILTSRLKQNVAGMETFLSTISDDDEKLFDVTLTMVQFADNPGELTRKLKDIKAIANSQTCEIIPLDHQQEKGYFTTLPLGNNLLSISRYLTTTSLGIFFPFRIKELRQYGESIVIGYNKLTGNVISADIKKLQNPNMIVLGKPGRGKSFFVKLMMLQVFLKTKDDIIICDPEGEYFPLVKVMKGQMIKLTAGSKHHINPLDIDADAEDFEVALSDKATFIMSMFEQILQGRESSDPQDRSIIDRALRKIYKPFLQSKDKDDLPIFTDLYNALSSDSNERAQYLKDTFEVYVNGSLNFFNHRTNIDMQNRVICFDIRDLSTALKDLGMLFVQETVWSKVSANRENKKYTRYFIDEFHVLLKDPQTAAYSRDIWKRFRKWMGMPCGITQNVADLMKSPEIKTIFDNSDCYVILGQDESEALMLCEELNLTQKQLETISTRNGAEGLFIYGADVMPYVGRIPGGTTLYKTITTKFNETDVNLYEE